ncbi:MAG TPA: C-GCAxxG-C-C family protein [Thermodesulfobacteriota bacterium]|nr:C-GCAxxG-C-C family protein [Thermodesulfobacteriota bacterium]
MNRVEKTVDLHENGGLNCSQAILTAFGESFGMDPETAKLLGRPWGGGMGHLGITCGYLTGAVLVLAQAINNKDERQARKDSFQAVQELFRRFKERHGTVMCKELLGADFSTEEGTKKIREEQLVAKHCYGYARDAAEILEELL